MCDEKIISKKTITLYGYFAEDNMDLISVIVPIFRVEEYIDQCIWSIRNQTYKNLEILLVDDGSDDRCPQICDQHAGEDGRIKVIHKPNGGLDSARKAGMLAATGKYVGYVDGDDWIEPEMYEKLHAYALQYSVDVVESGIIDSSSHMQSIRLPYLDEGCYKDEVFEIRVLPKLLYTGDFYEYGISAYMCTKLFLREKIVKYQMMQGKTNSIMDDMMVGLPCVAQTKRLYITHESYYHYRVRVESCKSQPYQEEMILTHLLECYPEICSRFKGTGLDEKQLHFFVMYWLLFKIPGVFDHTYKEDFLVPFGNIDREKKIVLYGAGAAGIYLERYIRSMSRTDIVGWADRNYQDLQETMGIMNPLEISDLTYDYVVISILKGRAVKMVRKDLLNMGVPEEKILWIMPEYLAYPKLLLSKVEFQGKKLTEIMGMNKD